MGQDDMIIESGQRWAINVDWLTANSRSLTAMASGSLCAKCRKKLKVDQREAKAGDILKAIKSCCAKSPDFITLGMPLQESMFRVFLANGNQPLTLDELGNQLNNRRGIDAYRTSVNVLSRLMRNDQHYGLRSVSD
jgi:hypothetical protein